MPRPFALPGARPRYAPDRVVDVQHIKLDLRVDIENRRIDGTCATTLCPILEGTRWIELDAVELEIRSVLRKDGADLDYAYDGKKLRIDLGQGTGAGERITVVIAYGASPRRGLYFVGPDEAYPKKPVQVWSQGQDEDSRHWFPCFDSPHEKATSEVVAEVPTPMFALSNGTLHSVNENPTTGTRTYAWRFDVPHSCYLITLVVGELIELKDRWNQVDIFYYVTPGREEEAKRALGRTPEMMALFSERFGLPYPYEKYAQVCVTDFIFGGMENTTATTLADHCLYDARAALDYDVEALVAHELAHHWFGDLVTCREWGQGWLNEGFATYAEYIWRDHAHGGDEAALELADWADQYFGEDSRRYRRPIATNVYDEPIDVFDHHLYEKGGLVLHMLRRMLGESSFWRALGHYVRKHHSGSVETRDLARAIEEATGRNLDWFFEQWISKAGHPELKVDYAWDSAARVVKLTIRQTQKLEGDTPLFRLPMEVRFRVDDQDLTFPIEVSECSEVFVFPLGKAPSQAILDPGQHVLKKVSFEKPKTLWLGELKNATNAIDRISAAKALSKHPSAEAILALERSLYADPFWGVRAASAESLGTMRTEAGRKVLADAVKVVQHPKARRAVIKALGEQHWDDGAAQALEPIVIGGDPSVFVEAEACLAMGKTRSPRAPHALRQALGRDSYLDLVRQHVYRGLAQARDDSAIPLLLEGTRYGAHPHGRRAAILALSELACGRHDREGRQVRERVEELLLDKDFRVQLTAVEGLASIGDARAVPALRHAAESELDGRIRRRAREVIRDLEEGRSRDDQIKHLMDEVDKLRNEVYGLRERLALADAGPPNGRRAKPPRRGQHQKAKAPTRTPAKKSVKERTSNPRRR